MFSEPHDSYKSTASSCADCFRAAFWCPCRLVGDTIAVAVCFLPFECFLFARNCPGDGYDMCNICERQEAKVLRQRERMQRDYISREAFAMTMDRNCCSKGRFRKLVLAQYNQGVVKREGVIIKLGIVNGAPQEIT